MIEGGDADDAAANDNNTRIACTRAEPGWT
jgi:hypothetical protein